MKIVIDVKNGSKTQNFGKNDLIVYDGKQWYVTTVEDLYSHLEKRYNDMIAKMDQKINDIKTSYAEFLLAYNEQNSKLLPIIENLLEKDEEK